MVASLFFVPTCTTIPMWNLQEKYTTFYFPSVRGNPWSLILLPNRIPFRYLASRLFVWVPTSLLESLFPLRDPFSLLLGRSEGNKALFHFRSQLMTSTWSVKKEFWSWLVGPRTIHTTKFQMTQALNVLQSEKWQLSFDQRKLTDISARKQAPLEILWY